MTTEVDISSVAFWSRPFGERDDAFRILRRTAPVSWHPPLETPGLSAEDQEPGFWALVTAEHIREASRDTSRFSSALRQVSVRPTPVRLAPNMLVADPPAHAVYRSALAAAFTPTALRGSVPAIERAVRQIVLRSTFQREFDVVTGIAAGVPARVLALLLGVPDAEIPRFLIAVDLFAGGGAPTGLTSEAELASWFTDASQYVAGLTVELLQFRARAPGNDLISLLAQHGARAGMSAEALQSTVQLLIVAGHDTMKQLISLAVLALVQHEDQRSWLDQDLDARFDTAFDELVRWTSPVLSFARTATEEVRLGGATIRRGDKLAMFYCSGNRDEREFDQPHELRLDRRPNRHVGFGGGGVHFCLGGALARIQLRAVLATLRDKAPHLELASPPLFPFNDAVHRVSTLRVRRR